MKPEEFLTEIISQLKLFNYKVVDQISDNLIDHLYSSEDDFDTKTAQNILQQLRNRRLFHLMQKVGDTLIQTGRHNYKIKRQYAQALIDQNNFTAAILVLQEIIAETAGLSAESIRAKEENVEARGLMGRVYKQQYINSKSPGIENNANFIKKAIKFYYDVYVSKPLERTWHGINVVALLKRATDDNIKPEGYPEFDELAKSILNDIKDKNNEKKADAWDFATAAEACVALNKPTEALEWLSSYASMPYCDAFELGSTLRQLEEVWQLDMGSETGQLLLPILRAELMKREGGFVMITPTELQQQTTAEDRTTKRYKDLLGDNIRSDSTKLEKVFGDESFKTYKWYMRGAKRCHAVARIGLDSTRGIGTGFLLEGKVLHESLGEEPVLVTNAHVISTSPEDKALRPEEAVLIFEAIDKDIEFRDVEIIWSSPSSQLDATIIKFIGEDKERLKELTENIDFYPVSKYLPVIDSDYSQRIYVIGHPHGGTLQLSFQDNILLDHQNHKIHYRTPTVGGSSGSPVFNQQWDLIGLHHAGDGEMPCLNNKPGTYQANEGIWIQAIKQELLKHLSS